MLGNCLALKLPVPLLPVRLFSAARQWPLLYFKERDGAASAEAALHREELNRQAERMLSEYGASILRLAYSYLHNLSDAEEILQDTLLQLLKTAPDLAGREHEKAWLLHVAANLSKNRIAYNAIRRTDELEEGMAAENREDLTFVWEAVKALPVKYREVIHLFYHEGYATPQIARILGVNPVTVRSRLQRGRARLKEILKEAYDFDETVS